eukprot:gnl/MRDRNA2_/MRDRNA2_20966_c0_seq1.p1 gnl/MRDRNA2_/MRDRNA2_20966_c0~~gnl/MRDRNA2_/MRDRNA2_20966_c0_seq1.p1  ORF type:complete len:384 (+),score=69.88 gnl/MRDRNA2_/MRDRNA2_20966_c0_seq1:76-1227(+)
MKPVSEDLMEVEVIGLTGQTLAVLTEEQDQTIVFYKRQLSDKLGVAITRLALVLNGLELADNATLRSGGVSQTSTLYLIFRQPRQAVTGSEDGLQLWDMDSGTCTRFLEGNGSMVKAIAVDWTAMLAVSGSEDNVLQLWDLSTGGCIQTFKGHSRPVSALGVDWPAKQMLSGSLDASVILWSLETGEKVQSFGRGAAVRALDADWDAGLVFLSRAMLVQLWTIESGCCLQNCPGHTGQVLSVAAHWKEKHALSGAVDCTLRQWCLVTGNCLKIIVIKANPQMWSNLGDAIWAISVNWHDEQVLIGSQDGTVQLWDMHDGKHVRTFDGYFGPVQTLTVDWAARQALSAATDRHLRLWDVDTGRCVFTLEKSGAPTKALVASWCK